MTSFLTEGPWGPASSLYLPYKCMERPLRGLSEMRYSEYLELGPDPKKPTLRGSRINTSLLLDALLLLCSAMGWRASKSSASSLPLQVLLAAASNFEIDQFANAAAQKCSS